MRKVKIEIWKANIPKFEGEGEKRRIVGSEEVDESIMVAFNNLSASMKPENMPRGLDKSRIYGNIIKAFEKAEESKVLELEEAGYMFLKGLLDDMPFTWGANKNLMNAVEVFLDAKSE